MSFRKALLFRFRWHDQDGARWTDEVVARDELEARRKIQARWGGKMDRRGFRFVNERGETAEEAG